MAPDYRDRLCFAALMKVTGRILAPDWALEGTRPYLFVRGLVEGEDPGSRKTNR
jgi:hypothetical protein